MASLQEIFELTLLTQGKAHEISLKLLKETVKTIDWSRISKDLVETMKKHSGLHPDITSGVSIFMIAMLEKILEQNKIIEQMAKSNEKKESFSEVVSAMSDLGFDPPELMNQVKLRESINALAENARVKESLDGLDLKDPKNIPNIVNRMLQTAPGIAQK